LALAVSAFHWWRAARVAPTIEDLLAHHEQANLAWKVLCPSIALAPSLAPWF
jgi:hypothetical protein